MRSSGVRAAVSAKVRGFHISALYSPWRRWAELAEEWVQVHRDPVRLQVFINTVLGESWEEQGDAVEADSLAGRLEEYAAEVPHGVGLLTAAVDVQKDRLEVQVMGWGAGEECWLVEFQQIHGDPGGGEVWEDLDDVLFRKFVHQSGVEVTISATFIDSGGHHTDEVYRYCTGRSFKRVYACKGQARPGSELVSRPSRNNRFRARLFMIGTDSAKDAIFSRLRLREPGPGYIHLPSWTEREWMAQLTAEKAVRRYIRGKGSKREYVKTRQRNEALDLTVYCLAALHSLGSVTVKSLGAKAESLSGSSQEPKHESKHEQEQEEVRSDRLGRSEIQREILKQQKKWDPYRGTRGGRSWVNDW